MSNTYDFARALQTLRSSRTVDECMDTLGRMMLHGHGADNSGFSNFGAEPENAPFYIWDSRMEACYRLERSNAKKGARNNNLSMKIKKVSEKDVISHLKSTVKPRYAGRKRPLSLLDKILNFFNWKTENVRYNERIDKLNELDVNDAVRDRLKKENVVSAEVLDRILPEPTGAEDKTLLEAVRDETTSLGHYLETGTLPRKIIRNNSNLIDEDEEEEHLTGRDLEKRAAVEMLRSVQEDEPDGPAAQGAEELIECINRDDPACEKLCGLLGTFRMRIVNTGDPDAPEHIKLPERDVTDIKQAVRSFAANYHNSTDKKLCLRRAANVLAPQAAKVGALRSDPQVPGLNNN